MPRPRRCSRPTRTKVEALKARGGYQTADVIDVRPDTPNLEAMLAKFTREHWHDEDEVRFIIEGRGLFHVHPRRRAGLRDRGRGRRSHPRAARHAPLVRSLRRSTHPRDPAVPGSVGLDAPLHGHRRRPGIPAGVLRALVPDATAIRARVSARLAPAGVQAILLDIEGTTTPIAFVVDMLFPYARAHLRRHVEQHATAPEYARLLEQLRDEHASDREAGQPVPAWVDTPVAAHLASVVGYLEWLMDRDRKSTALKDLQGRIWEEGYRLGELQGEVFADVPRGARALAGARAGDRHLLLGQRAGPAAALPPLVGRRSHADICAGTSTRRSARRPTPTAIAASPRRWRSRHRPCCSSPT